MTLDEFVATLENDAPPGNLPDTLQALWVEAKGDWKQAHRIVQAVDSADAAWIHAYLHRKEGDRGNAAHWYAKAGRKPGSLTFEDEWAEIVMALLPQVT